MEPTNESRSGRKGLKTHIYFFNMDFSPRENSTHAHRINHWAHVLPALRHEISHHAQHDRSPLDQHTAIHVTPLNQCLRGPKREKQDNSHVDQREGIHGVTE